MEVFVDSNEKLNIAMEFCETDLEKIMTSQGDFFYGYEDCVSFSVVIFICCLLIRFINMQHFD
jgi:hypothetical protein